MIRVTIDGKIVFLSEPVTILEAAKRAGIKIPTLCAIEGLTPWGGCRLCLVEIEKIPRPQTACTTMVADGMIIRTETEAIIKARRAVLEFLLINHPLECPVCDKAGECELQDAVLKYGPSHGRFKEGKRRSPEIIKDPLLVRNMKRCILCTRCVRTCRELQGADALSVISRGDRSVIEPFSGERFDCEYCGNCLSACPVGALISRLHLHEYRPWMVETVDSICGFCGVGCRILIQKRGNSIIRFWSGLGMEEVPKKSQDFLGYEQESAKEPNNGLTCAAGRFGYDFIDHEDRPRCAFMRVGDTRYTLHHEEAISRAASSLGEIKKKYGASAIAGIAGGRLTNEDAYLFGKLIRGLGSNNIDSIARLGYLQMEQFFEELLGPGATANRLQGIVNSEAIIVAGGDPLSIAPVFGVHIRQAYLRGADILTIGHYPGLKRHRTWELEDRSLIELTAEIWKSRAEKVELGSGEKIISFLSEFLSQVSQTSPQISSVVENLSKKELISIVLGNGILQNKEGPLTLFLYGLIALLLDARVYILQESPNEQGLIDMGILPDMLPGGRDLSIDVWREHVEDIWGFPVSNEKGHTLYEIMELIEGGRIKALYIAGIDPVTELPGGGRIQKALNKLELLIVQDPFFTETMSLAHIGIPVRTWPEKEGSFTNFERRIQFLRRSIEPGLKNEILEDWQIFKEIGQLLGISMSYNSVDDIWREICTVSGLHKNLSPLKLKKGLLWPYEGEPLRHTRSVIGEWIERLKPEIGQKGLQKEGLKIVLEKSPLPSATISRYSKAIGLISGRPFVRVSSKTREVLKAGASIEEEIKIAGPFGEITFPIKIDNSLPDGMLLVPFLKEGKGLLSITDFAVNPLGVPIVELKLLQ
ncbi:MAG: molybdopterin-dependent oxidoreductase [Thermodesulfovibrionales bacterium]